MVLSAISLFTQIGTIPTATLRCTDTNHSFLRVSTIEVPQPSSTPTSPDELPSWFCETFGHTDGNVRLLTDALKSSQFIHVACVNNRLFRPSPRLCAFGFI